MNPEIAPVLDEISAILKKHDMAGLFMLANKTHVDFRLEISPSWSCAKLETNAEGLHGLRVRCKREDYPSAEAQKKILQETLGTIVTFRDCTRLWDENLEVVLHMLSEHIDFDGKSTLEDPKL